jgi:hypothetical protein
MKSAGDLRLAPSRAHFPGIVPALLRVVKNYENKTRCIGVLKLRDSMLGSGHLREFGHAVKRWVMDVRRKSWQQANVLAEGPRMR